METVLLVDDNRSIRQFCEIELKTEGYHVILARDGRQALDELRQQPIDVAVIDVRMPRMSGMELIGRLKAINPRLPVILYTAHHMDYVSDHRAWPAFACIEKTEDVAELKLAIALALQRCGRGTAWAPAPPAASIPARTAGSVAAPAMSAPALAPADESWESSPIVA